MRYDKTKVMTLSALIVAVLLLGVGFAAFSSNLIINSTASVTPDSNTFKVVFSNKNDSVDTTDVTPTLTPTTITASKGIIDNTSSPTLTNQTLQSQDKKQYIVYMYIMQENILHT